MRPVFYLASSTANFPLGIHERNYVYVDFS
jgi:hypothetical protein